MMGAAALLCVVSLLEAVAGFAPDDSTIRTAVAAWLSDSAAAEGAYGHISTWETGGVTDMEYLFCGDSYDLSGAGYCNTASASFNEDIGAWDTSGVTTMYLMFYGASAFDQDLDWCVDDDVVLSYAFYNAKCASTYCGVKWETNTGDCDMSRTGNVMINWKIRWAVQAWLSDATAAKATYGHISTWETGGVTDMEYLFCACSSCGGCNAAAASFNDDIGAWDTSGVKTMYGMFFDAYAFNQDIGAWDTSGVTTMDSMFVTALAFDQDIGAWDTSGVTTMDSMFVSALAFDQDLGWCVDDDVSLSNAFYNTPCASTSCGVVVMDDCPTPAPTPRPSIYGPNNGYIMTDSSIRTAVSAWLRDATAAAATYGHISTWETGGVTDMSKLFHAASTFNEDIGAWDTSGVKTMYKIFYQASAFNQDISNWDVSNVKSMRYMFYYALAFDQDLGWCVENDVDLEDAFDQTKCKSTSCGVAQKDVIGICETPLPCLISNEHGYCIIHTEPLIIIIVLVLAGFGACVCCRKKKDETYAAAACRVLCGCLCCCCFCCRKKAEPSSADSPPDSLAKSPSGEPDEEATAPESLETRATEKAKAAETVERPGLARKLSSFLFGEQEEEPTALSVAEAEEAPPAKQPPPLPPRRTEPEPAASKAEEMYNQIAAWYSEPENAALRATWAAFPDPDEFQTWPGFVAVTNAFLDREAG